MELGIDQSAALDHFSRFKDSGATVFALLGAAGTGKSLLTSLILKDLTSGFSFAERIVAAPTHKASNVVRRFLSEAGLSYEVGFDRFTHECGRIVTGTTAQLLGLQPVIMDEQTEDSRKFASVSKGMIGQVEGIEWIVVDEVSMLSSKGLAQIEAQAALRGARVLVIGDPGQLPPVSEKPIVFEDLAWRFELRQIMRQAADSAIPHVGAAVRHGDDWRAVQGGGVDHFNNPAGAFLDEIDGMPDDERDQAVYVAYTNARVHAVQEAACQKVYGHGRLEVAPGEIVIANNNLSVRVNGPDGRQRAVTLCANGDRLRVVEVGERGAWGRMVVLQKDGMPSFDAEFLDEHAYSDPQSAFNIELRNRSEKANDLQRRWMRDRGDYALDSERKEAWSAFFQLKDSTVVSLSHPFAITSHKSQGSTYRRAFVDAANLSRFDPRALYVAATRPSEELIIG